MLPSATLNILGLRDFWFNFSLSKNIFVTSLLKVYLEGKCYNMIRSYIILFNFILKYFSNHLIRLGSYHLIIMTSSLLLIKLGLGVLCLAFLESSFFSSPLYILNLLTSTNIIEILRKRLTIYNHADNFKYCNILIYHICKCGNKY